MKNRILLIHPCPRNRYLAYDILIKKGTKTPKIGIKWLYNVNCTEVEKFIKKHPEYTFRGSEDLQHIDSTNRGQTEWLNKLIEKYDFQVIIVPPKKEEYW